MSEYQYYEFLAIDRPLSQKDMVALRAITSRAEITPTRLSNVYNYGDFRGDPRALMRKYFDAMVYVTNWGTRQLMLKLPRHAIDPQVIKPYCIDDVLEMEVGKHYVLLDIQYAEEGGGGWIADEEAEGWMPSLAPLRAELLRGEYAGLYLAWLHGALLEYDPEVDEEPRIEPHVPSGLRTLSASCKALCEYLGIDEELVAAAALQSEELAKPEDVSAELRAWLKRLPAVEKEGWLLQIATGSSAGVEGEILRRFRADRPRAARAAPRPRTIAEIMARAEVVEKEREEREASARAKKQERRISALAKNEAQAWKTVEEHVASKKAERYDDAAVMLLDLRELAERGGKRTTFEKELRALLGRHPSKQALRRRLRERGLV